MFRRILVPVDGSGPSTAGLRVALSLARERKARLRLVHLSRELAPTRNGDVPASQLYARVKERGEELLRRYERLCLRRGVTPQTALYVAIAGRAAKVIVKEAKRWRADLIVMGTHGRRGITRLALGSDAEQVVRRSPVPVLLTRAKRR
ncbi:MAG TPA: universal stress protein [Burkholderiales bacterium]|nr:universal stress protein [Burkholderiales bacterium]